MILSVYVFHPVQIYTGTNLDTLLIASIPYNNSVRPVCVVILSFPDKISGNGEYPQLRPARHVMKPDIITVSVIVVIRNGFR